jgi:RNA recognition motif-containing protein
MLVYIGNLPGNSTLIELQNFLGNHEMSVDFTAHRHENNDSHFLLIKTNSNESADDLIKELNGKFFYGEKIEARKFIKRSEQPQEWTKEERRTSQLELDFI